MIVLASIKEIKRTDSQINELIVTIVKVLAICSPHTTPEAKASFELYNPFTKEEVLVLRDLLKYNIVGQIPKYSVRVCLMCRFTIGRI